MNPFQEMLRKTTSSPHHDKMMRFVAPLNDHFGVNHFWYYKITHSGYYTFLGTHADWNEYCFEIDNIQHFPCLRHPNTLKHGINLMKQGGNDDYQQVLKDAWNRFNINFNFQLINRTSEGIEAYGFATKYDHPHIDETLLNELDVLRYFIKQFQFHNQRLLQLLDDNQVDLASHIGTAFYKQPNNLPFSQERNLFLKKMGADEIFQSLTKREKEMLKFIAQGYPASYIAQQMRISYRTAQNYMETLKDKLHCHSKVEMIQKAQDLLSILNLF